MAAAYPVPGSSGEFGESGVARFNELPAEEARELLHACCDVPAWVEAVLCGRPYADRRRLLEHADLAARRLTPTEVDRALAAHPRIGDLPADSGRESSWSRGEQRGVERDEASLRQLKEVNLDYERRFGRVFLICAAGMTSAQILDAARARLGHDEATERRVVAEELRKIALLRVERVLDG
ncbi:2-oxo-4-hydroxy-4-carboxy-5-ureidoimidazoline decarboxylase [Haloechinothrix sp. YIM 98757]|uniref:2-oxo-4-hydroxy-4-carboxy-5-ureidoimidazoline decarboxylase n=1 Tax=Haloechinothrix aidingensis TaxID=2752311 RepID=A0A837ZXE4_9PSEU|nr:2-oxo-4-hydroxy-4-carboxy-5-ureidoimidazoline decarboxylase [Haloechinothrix aidingensis]MBA0124834.1 2-oxo-4-hydroxy-4-carboxy-5-ureidoimidazoline decarboxylase [Haloechinothrix aidingensis]